MSSQFFDGEFIHLLRDGCSYCRKAVANGVGTNIGSTRCPAISAGSVSSFIPAAQLAHRPVLSAMIWFRTGKSTTWASTARNAPDRI